MIITIKKKPPVVETPTKKIRLVIKRKVNVELSEDEQLKELEKKISLAQKKKKAKANKKKMATEIVKPTGQLRAFHAPWVKDVMTTYNDKYQCTMQNDIDRIDIQSKDSTQGWRLCIVGLNNKQVDVSLFLEGKPDFMNPQVSFLHMDEKNTEYIVEKVFDLKDNFVAALDT